MHTGRMPPEYEDRDLCEVPMSQGTPSGSRRQAWNGFSLTDFQRNQLCQHIDIGLLASRSVRQYISVV